MAKKYRILLLLMLTLALLSGCFSAPDVQYFSYRGESFCAELRGTLHSLPFCAAITVEKTASDYRVQVEYLGDPVGNADYTLADLTVVATFSLDGTPNGAATVTYHGIATDVESALISDLLLPVSSLLSLTSFATVQKEEDGFRLGLQGGGELVLDGQMRPLSFSSSPLSFSVVWWDVKK